MGSEPGVMQQETPHAFGTRYWLSAQICCYANWKYCKEYKNWAKAALGQSQSVITAHVYLTLSTHSKHGRGYCFSVSWVSDVIVILRYQGACCKVPWRSRHTANLNPHSCELVTITFTSSCQEREETAIIAKEKEPGGLKCPDCSHWTLSPVQRGSVNKSENTLQVKFSMQKPTCIPCQGCFSGETHPNQPWLGDPGWATQTPASAARQLLCFLGCTSTV